MDDDTYAAKLRLAGRRRDDEHRRVARARGEAWEQDIAIASTRRIDGPAVNIRAIKPRLTACATADDYAIH